MEIQNFDYLIKLHSGDDSCEDGSCDICDSSSLGFGVVGLALNGVAILSALSIDSVDPLYPPSPYPAESLDRCQAHPQVTRRLSPSRQDLLTDFLLRLGKYITITFRPDV